MEEFLIWRPHWNFRDNCIWWTFATITSLVWGTEKNQSIECCTRLCYKWRNHSLRILGLERLGNTGSAFSSVHDNMLFSTIYGLVILKIMIEIIDKQKIHICLGSVLDLISNLFYYLNNFKCIDIKFIFE